MKTYAEIWDKAVSRKGEGDLKSRFPKPKSAAELRRTDDARLLATMTQLVFSAGFRWQVIESKWGGFEQAFHAFDPATVAAFGDEEVAQLKADTRIVRNGPNIVSTIKNAAFVRDQGAAHGSFAAWIADWPQSDIVGLWDALKSGGSRLGGSTGPRFLRAAGKDTFVLSQSVVACLKEQGLVTKGTSKRDLAAAQEAFSTWAAQSGEPFGVISIVCACSVD